MWGRRGTGRPPPLRSPLCYSWSRAGRALCSFLLPFVAGALRVPFRSSPLPCRGVLLFFHCGAGPPLRSPTVVGLPSAALQVVSRSFELGTPADMRPFSFAPFLSWMPGCSTPYTHLGLGSLHCALAALPPWRRPPSRCVLPISRSACTSRVVRPPMSLQDSFPSPPPVPWLSVEPLLPCLPRRWRLWCSP